MRAIPDINGKRKCRKCNKLLPVNEFSQLPRRHVCKLCRSRMYKPKTPLVRSYIQTLMAHVQWDARSVFRCPHNLRVSQISQLPCVAKDTTDARIVPIDCRTGIAPYNGVIVHKITARCLRTAFLEVGASLPPVADERLTRVCAQGDLEMYTEILSIRYPDARKPIEIVGFM